MDGALDQEDAAVVGEHDARGHLGVEEEDERTRLTHQARRLAGFEDAGVERVPAAGTEPIGGRPGHSSSSSTRPVAPVLFQEGQRLEALHPIQEDGADEVIDLVLDHAGEEVAGREVQRFAPPVVRLNLDVGVPRNLAAEIRDAQAPLPVFLQPVGDGDDPRVDQDRRRRGRVADCTSPPAPPRLSRSAGRGGPAAPQDPRHDTPAWSRSCRRSSAGCPAPGCSSPARRDSQDRIAQVGDFQDGHDLTLLQWLVPRRRATRSTTRRGGTDAAPHRRPPAKTPAVYHASSPRHFAPHVPLR